MLEIYIHGPRESGFLDLDAAAKLHLESDSDLFDEELNLGTFSLPIDIPWTGRNRRLMGFAERLKNSDAKGVFFKAVVYDSGFPEVPAAKLTIIGKDGNFAQSAKGKFTATISGAKGLFGSLIKNKKMTELRLGGKIAWSGKDSRHFATDLMKGDHPEYSYISFAPVAIENFFSENRKDYDGEFLARDTVNTVVITGGGADEWVFGRPLDNGSPAVETHEQYRDYRTVPFFKTKFVVRKIFEEHGFKVSGEFFERREYDDLVIFNNYGIEYYSPGHVDYTRSIFPANHMPPVLIIDYLKGLFSFFSIYPVFTGDNEARLYFRKDLRKEKRVFSLNGIVQELYSSSREEIQEQDGYTISYDWGNDDYVSDRVKELTDKNMLGTVNTVSDLNNLNPGRQLTIDDIAFVAAENMYYQVADATAMPVKWDAYSEALEPYKEGEGARDVSLGMSTLCTYVEEDTGTGLMVKRNYLGCRMAGSYLNSKGQPVISEFSNKIFFCGRLPNSSSINVPTSYNYNRTPDGTMINVFSLALNGSSGLAETFHKAWQDIRNQEVVRVTLKVDRRIMRSIANTDFLEVNGVHFLLKKKEPVVPQEGLMSAELTVV